MAENTTYVYTITYFISLIAHIQVQIDKKQTTHSMTIPDIKHFILSTSYGTRDKSVLYAMFLKMFL